MCYSQTPLESWPSWTRSAGSRRPPTSPSSKRLSSSLATTRSSRRRSSSRTSANSRSCTTPERWASKLFVQAQTGLILFALACCARRPRNIRKMSSVPAWTVTQAREAGAVQDGEEPACSMLISAWAHNVSKSSSTCHPPTLCQWIPVYSSFVFFA